MKVESLAIPDVKLITPQRISDERGYFIESYNQRVYKQAGIAPVFVQDNQSYSKNKGTVRGLHFQTPPFAQAKLVRALSGAILDVAVDAREGSPTFGEWVSARLSAEDGAQMYIPVGFLHGFVTLEPDTMVAYKVDAYYDRGADGAVKWDDPDLGIDWGISAAAATVSEKDARAQSWAAFESPF
ncbi:MAG TPA: dTDP-4-dehydrorhamnose 3,5-epimerase [Parvularculaceae bacterium]|nr:dTDP-4-dehydrorhamnose 3,5-epimerase [Parvularculaceae bacterium]